MRNFLSASAGVLAIAFTQLAFAQSPLPCGVKGIRTAQGVPKLGTAAFNPEYPARTNTFNWYYGQTNNSMSWNLNSVAINEASIWMPYWQTDNTQLSHIQGKLDLPTDGWELMKRDLGYDDAGMPSTGTRNPYVVLYNKRSGMLRVFAAIGDLFNSYQFAQIRLRFNDIGATRKSATLNRMEGIGTALLDTPPGLTQEFVAMGVFLNQKSKWFMADFPMEYDPCACQFNSKLKVEINLISSANIQMTGVTTGTIVTTDIANPGATQTSSDFNSLRQLGKKVGASWSKGQQTYSSTDKWASDVKSKLGIPGNTPVRIAAIDALKDAMKTSGFLKAGLNSLPYIGLAVSTLDAFFGGGKEESGPQPVALQPMSVNMSTQTTGTISAPALYTDISFNNPGTRIITTALEYPYYNEAMGVFSLLTKPTVQYTNTVFTNINGVSSRRFQFKVPQQLQYAVNPASGLEVQDFQVALVQNANTDYPERLPAGWEYEGVAAQTGGSNLHVFRTPYVNSGCLANNTFSLETVDPRFQTQSEVVISPSSGTTFLKLILNLRRPGAPATEQNTLIVLKYPVTTQLVTQFTSTAGQPCVAVQAQASTSDVQALCTGSVYQAAVLLRPAGGTASTSNNSSATAPAAVADMAVYPNPASDAATIRFAAGAEGLASAYVVDMLGKRVLSIMQDEHIAAEVQEYSFPTAGLPAGLYRCVMETADGKRVSTPLSIVR